MNGHDPEIAYGLRIFIVERIIRAADSIDRRIQSGQSLHKL